VFMLMKSGITKNLYAIHIKLMRIADKVVNCVSLNSAETMIPSNKFAPLQQPRSPKSRLVFLCL
jgi:hypothetical protein